MFQEMLRVRWYSITGVFEGTATNGKAPVLPS